MAIKLTMENVDEIGLELLKKENENSTTINYLWDRNDSLDAVDLEKAKIAMERMGSNRLEEGIYEYLYDNEFLNIVDMQEEIIENVLKKYTSKNIDEEEFEKLHERLQDIINDGFLVNMNEKELLDNTILDELDIFLVTDNKKSLEDQLENIEKFTNYGDLEETFAKNEFNSVAFLIQSQGYEVEDFYDKEKVENSKFLKSLHNEIEQMEKEIGEVGSLVFTKIGGYNLKEYIELEETEKNIMIPKEGIIVGLHNIGLNENTLLEIELEKDIVVDRDNIEVVSEYSENTYHRLINEKGYLANSREYEKFEITDNESFKMHEIDLDKVIENSNKYFKKQIEKENERELD